MIKKIKRIFNYGYNNGFKDGYEEGLKVGLRRGNEVLEKLLKKHQHKMDKLLKEKGNYERIENLFMWWNG